MRLIVVAVVVILGLALKGRQKVSLSDSTPLLTIDSQVGDSTSHQDDIARCMTPERARRQRRRNG